MAETRITVFPPWLSPLIGTFHSTDGAPVLEALSSQLSLPLRPNYTTKTPDISALCPMSVLHFRPCHQVPHGFPRTRLLGFTIPGTPELHTSEADRSRYLPCCY